MCCSQLKGVVVRYFRELQSRQAGIDAHIKKFIEAHNFDVNKADLELPREHSSEYKRHQLCFQLNPLSPTKWCENCKRMFMEIDPTMEMISTLKMMDMKKLEFIRDHILFCSDPYVGTEIATHSAFQRFLWPTRDRHLGFNDPYDFMACELFSLRIRLHPEFYDDEFPKRQFLFSQNKPPKWVLDIDSLFNIHMVISQFARRKQFKLRFELCTDKDLFNCSLETESVRGMTNSMINKTGLKLPYPYPKTQVEFLKTLKIGLDEIKLSDVIMSHNEFTLTFNSIELRLVIEKKNGEWMIDDNVITTETTVMDLLYLYQNQFEDAPNPNAPNEVQAEQNQSEADDSDDGEGFWRRGI